MKSAIDKIVFDIESRSTTAREQVENALKRAKATDDYNALLTLTEERALDRADEIDAAIARGDSVGRLAGVPFVVKDNFLAFGAPTTAASKMLENFDAPLQATAVENLEKEGAICIGKANLDAFAHGGSTENSAFGVTLNAFDKTRVAGGSSGGSAVVTALDVVPFALGTDTGGSIRQPASFNGVVGYKPTYGMVSRFGVVAMASSTDTIGCFAKSSQDVETVMDIMSGRDASDMTTLPDYFVPNNDPITPKKIGVIRQFMTDEVDEDVRRVTEDALQKLRDKGHTIEEVDIATAKHSVAMYYVIVPAEISSNLARYDGIRYGHRAEASSLAELYGRSRDEGFVTENKRRIMIGSYVLSSGYFDAYYQQAQKARTLLINEFKDLFKNYDMIVCPVSPTPAFGIGEHADDPVQMYLADAMTIPASLAGLPAVSVPAGFSKNGLPIGVQLIADQKQDAELLKLAKEVEAIS